MLLAIDPGNHGAYALFHNSQLVSVHDLPVTNNKLSPQLLAAELRAFTIGQAIIEKVGAMPGQGVTSMFNFGLAVGQIEGILAALSIPYTFLAPQVWKRAYGLIKTPKEASRQKALELFPSFADRLTRKGDVDRAEAMLIGLHHINKGGDSFGQKVQERRRRQEVLTTSPTA